jgi:mono/diheme cytochrome c family protein
MSFHAWRRLALGAALALVSPALGLAAETPGFTADQAARGAQLYAGSCALCHGDNLDDGQFAPPLKGADHAAYWRGRSAQDLLAFIDTMMPPSQPGGLGPQGGADVYAYVLQSGGAAAGDKPLPADPAALAGLAATP